MRAVRGEPSVLAAAWRAPPQTRSARDGPREALGLAWREAPWSAAREVLDPPQPASSAHPARTAARTARARTTALPPRLLETTSTTSHHPGREDQRVFALGTQRYAAGVRSQIGQRAHHRPPRRGLDGDQRRDRDDPAPGGLGRGHAVG